MHSHHTGNHIGIIRQCMPDPGCILHYGLTGLVHAVTVRNLIAQTCTHSHFLRRILNGKKAVMDLAEARMMIKYCSYTVFNRIDISNSGALACLLIGQMTVDRPPHTIQNIQETVGIVAVDTQPPGHGTVNMFMGINESRHDHAASGVYKLCFRKFLPDVLKRSHFLNNCPFHSNRTVLEKWLCAVSGHQASVSNY